MKKIFKHINNYQNTASLIFYSLENYTASDIFLGSESIQWHAKHSKTLRNKEHKIGLFLGANKCEK